MSAKSCFVGLLQWDKLIWNRCVVLMFTKKCSAVWLVMCPVWALRHHLMDRWLLATGFCQQRYRTTFCQLHRLTVKSYKDSTHGDMSPVRPTEIEGMTSCMNKRWKKWLHSSRDVAQINLKHLIYRFECFFLSCKIRKKINPKLSRTYTERKMEIETQLLSVTQSLGYCKWWVEAFSVLPAQSEFPKPFKWEAQHLLDCKNRPDCPV